MILSLITKKGTKMSKKGFFDTIEENIIAVGIIIMVIMETANAALKLFFPG